MCRIQQVPSTSCLIMQKVTQRKHLIRTRYIPADLLLKSTLPSYVLRFLVVVLGVFCGFAFFFQPGAEQANQANRLNRATVTCRLSGVEEIKGKVTSAVVHTPSPNSGKDLEGLPDPSWFSHLYCQYSGATGQLVSFLHIPWPFKDQ